MTKAFDANRGLLLDASFETHRGACQSCRRFNDKKPATVGLLCLEGAVLWKRDTAKQPKRIEPIRDEFYASKADMKRAMRYRGE